jgi:XisH protein
VSAKDVVHNAIRVALEKDNWSITDDPLYLKASAKVGLYIDLGAEKLLVAERSGQKIAVEVKSFLGLSAVNEFHLALGQFLNYRLALKRLDPDRILYLAVPVDTYETFFVGNYSGLLKTAVSARAKRGLKRLRSVVSCDAHHHIG